MAVVWVKALSWVGHFLLMWSSSDEIKMTNSNNNSNCKEVDGMPSSLLRHSFSSAISQTAVNVLPCTSVIKTKTNLGCSQLRRT